MSDKIEPIPGKLKIDQNYISEREKPNHKDFQEKLNEEIQKRLNNKKEKPN